MSSWTRIKERICFWWRKSWGRNTVTTTEMWNNILIFFPKRNVTLSNFPLDQIGKNFTSLFNLLWNSNLPCYNNDDRPGSHHLLKRCFLYGKERKCSEAIFFLNDFLWIFSPYLVIQASPYRHRNLLRLQSEEYSSRLWIFKIAEKETTFKRTRWK